MSDAVTPIHDQLVQDFANGRRSTARKCWFIPISEDTEKCLTCGSIEYTGEDWSW